MDKQLIYKRFRRRIASYSRAAAVQAEMAGELLARLAAFSGGRREYERIFEFGCGSGMLTGKIVEDFFYKDFILNDLVPECAPLAMEFPGSASFIPGDIESIAFPGHVDLIISGATLQWVSELEVVFGKAARALAPGGVLAASTFAPGNLSEIWELTGVGLAYASAEEISQAAKAFFGRVKVSSCERVIEFDSPLEVLRHLQATGVNSVVGMRWTRGELERFSAAYRERFSRGDKVVLTYTPMYIFGGQEEA